MARDAATPDNALFPSKDRMGFAVPVSPGHSLLLLNSYMRTDLLLCIHRHVHRMRDENAAGSPIHHLADSIAHVVPAWDGINLFEYVGRNTLHIDPDFECCPEPDYAHDIKLMKHHLRTPGDEGTFPEDDIRADIDCDGKWFFSHKDGKQY